jgi:hypothetical protein
MSITITLTDAEARLARLALSTYATEWRLTARGLAHSENPEIIAAHEDCLAQAAAIDAVYERICEATLAYGTSVQGGH